MKSRATIWSYRSPSVRTGGSWRRARRRAGSNSSTPDGETLVAGSEDGSLALLGPTVWTDDVEDLGSTLCRVAGRGLTEDEWTEFVPFKPYDAGCPSLDASA